MPSKRKTQKKRYSSPSFKIHDAKSAKAELEARGQSGDPNVHRILRSIDEKFRAKLGSQKSKLDESA